MPDILQPFTAWLIAHTYVVVFVAALIDATGLPLPGRMLLIAAGAVAGAANASIVFAIVLGAVGVAITDHGWYFAGAFAGGRLLNLYCRLPIVVFRSVYTEVNARLQAQAMALGGPVTYLDDDEAQRAGGSVGGTIERPWQLWRKKALAR